MQAPPPTGTTGKAPPGVRLLGAGGGAGVALEKALVTVAAGAGAVGTAPPTAAAQPTNVIPKIQMNCTRIRVTRYRLGCRGRGRADTLRLAIGGTGLVVRATAGTSQTTDAPTVEADNAATRLRQRRKPGGNHRQGPAASKAAGILWRRWCFAGQSACRRCIRCRTAADHYDKHGRGTAQSDSRHAFVHHDFQLYVLNVTSI